MTRTTTPAPADDQARAETELHRLGRTLDAQALQGSTATELDATLDLMRAIHLRTRAALTTTASTA